MHFNIKHILTITQITTLFNIFITFIVPFFAITMLLICKNRRPTDNLGS